MWQYNAGFISAAEHTEGRSKRRGLSEGAGVGTSVGDHNDRRKKRAIPEDYVQLDQQPDLPQPQLDNPANASGGQGGAAATESHSTPPGAIDIEPPPEIEAETDAGIVDNNDSRDSPRHQEGHRW
jgi:hypothetical protein